MVRRHRIIQATGDTRASGEATVPVMAAFSNVRFSSISNRTLLILSLRGGGGAHHT